MWQLLCRMLYPSRYQPSVRCNSMDKTRSNNGPEYTGTRLFDEYPGSRVPVQKSRKYPRVPGYYFLKTQRVPVGHVLSEGFTYFLFYHMNTQRRHPALRVRPVIATLVLFSGKINYSANSVVGQKPRDRAHWWQIPYLVTYSKFVRSGMTLTCTRYQYTSMRVAGCNRGSLLKVNVRCCCAYCLLLLQGLLLVYQQCENSKCGG